MTLKTRIDRLERRAGIGEPAKPTIAFFDGVLDGSISEDEFARYVPALREILPEGTFEYCGDDGNTTGQEC
jgi:hypothetical protein